MAAVYATGHQEKAARTEHDSGAPIVSISIVHHDGLKMFRECLQSIFANPPSVPFEIVIVDNASVDGAMGMLETDFPQISKVIRNSQRHGFAENQNRGMAESAGQYIFVLNDDTIVHKGAIDILVDFLDKNPQVAVAGPRLLNGDGTLQQSCYKFPSPLRCVWENTLLTAAFPNSQVFGDYRNWQHDTVRFVDFIIGAALMVRKQTIEQVGAFDLRFFMYSEETDWQKRMHEQGWQIALCPDAEVIHLGGQSTTGIKDRQFCESNLSARKYIAKHYGAVGAIIQRLAYIVGSLIRLTLWAIIWLVRPDKRQTATINLKLWSRLLRWWLGLGPHERLGAN